jgi:hypothetical protein
MPVDDYGRPIDEEDGLYVDPFYEHCPACGRVLDTREANDGMCRACREEWVRDDGSRR